MRALLLGLAASAAMVPVAATAESPERMAFVANPATSIQGGFAIGRHDGDFRRQHRRSRGNDGSVFIYDRDYQGDSAWRSDSFNDWWHDRPDRAYPRWVANNQNCERKWFAGDTLRC